MSYNRRTVELLMPALWDSDYDYGMRQPTAPNPDMPKASADKSHGNTLYAMLAELRWTWRHATIPAGERQALFLRYADGLPQPPLVDPRTAEHGGYTSAVIGRILGVSRQAADQRVERGIGRMVAALNGDEYQDGYDGQEEDAA